MLQWLFELSIRGRFNRGEAFATTRYLAAVRGECLAPTRIRLVFASIIASFFQFHLVLSISSPDISQQPYQRDAG